MKFSFLFRTRVILFFVVFFALILIVKLFFVQVVQSNAYREIAQRQYATPSKNIYERGNIYFQRKDGQLVSAATQTSGFKIAIDPNKIVDPENVFNKINKIAALDYDEFITKAGKKNDPYEEIAGRLKKEEADAISLLKIPGLNIFKEKWRFYPGGNLASHLLGFVGYRDDELSGRYGLEKQYDIELARNDNNPYVNFFAEVFSNVNKTLFKNEPREGDIVTTIEPAVQGFLEKKLLESKEKYQIESIGGIIMNPKNGSIYAMGIKPDFNPNDFSKVEKISIFSNPFMEYVFEFGSIVKPLIMAAALNEGVVNADSAYNDKGAVVVEKKEISNFDKK